jgi:hypothetical protein
MSVKRKRTTTPLSVTVDTELYTWVETCRGMVSRSKFINMLLRRARRGFRRAAVAGEGERQWDSR